MKKQFLLPVISLLVATLLLAALPTEADAAIYEDTVRLHILANSDSAKDQEIKLALRDHILRTYGARLGECKSREEAEKTVTSLLSEIRESANSYLATCGVSYRAEVTLTEEHYGTRQYESFTLPAGYYPSLRILLGEAGGQNWWCVMYPPLCLDMAIREENTCGQYSKNEEALISGRYKIRFKLLESVTELFGQKTKNSA